MVRRPTRARLAALLFVVALVFGGAGASRAQGLPSLTVTALSLTSSRTSVPPGVTFAVRIHVHVAQHVSEIPWLVLPNVTNLTILGDEKHTTPVPGDGTDYVEILSVAAVQPGEATLSPAYVDAQDPSRGGKPFRFSSNALRIAVRAETAAPAGGYAAWARRLGATLLRIAAALAVVVALGLILTAVARRFRRPPKTFVTLPPARPVQPANVADRSAEIRTMAARLSGVRSRENAAALRRALFAYAGARHEETLEALLERVPPAQRDLRIALRAAERATFVDEPNVQGAIEDLLDAVRHMGLG